MRVNTQVEARTQAEKWRAKQGLPVDMGKSIASLRRAKRTATVAATAEADAAAAAHRATDPVECAKRVLQQRGRVVFAASVQGGPIGDWYVSGCREWLSGVEVVALAAKITGGAATGSPRRRWRRR